MKLENYLADYLEQEKAEFTYVNEFRIQIDTDSLQKLIKQGLDAFESTTGETILLIHLGTR